MLTEAEQIIEIVTGIFDDLGISYMIGGSVASSVHGVFRYTNDIDFVADISAGDVGPLVAAFKDFYADDEMITDAVETRSSFSVLQLELMIKVDVFIKANDDWTDEVWRRREFDEVSVDGTVSAYLPSAEDAILQKIRWFQLGGGVSDRQWSDILGVLKMRAEKLDYTYLREWAARLGLSDLLDRAIHATKSA
jgi:hypothetical protein